MWFSDGEKKHLLIGRMVRKIVTEERHGRVRSAGSVGSGRPHRRGTVSPDADLARI